MRARAALAAAALAVALGACSDDDSPTADPAALIAGAPDVARDAGTAHLEMNAHVGQQETEVTGSGVVDFENDASSFELSAGGTTLEYRILDGTVFSRAPGGALPDGKEWAAVELDDIGSGAESDLSNPAGFIDALRGVTGEVEELDRTDIGGTEVDGYRVTVDLEAAIDDLPDDRESARSALEQLAGIGADELELDVWIDEDGRPARISFDLEDARASMQVDLTDWGTDVEIEAPDEDDVLRVENRAGG